MKKGRIGLILLLAASLTGCLLAASCAHKHSFGAWVTTPATCTEDGYRERSCKCGETETEILPKTGHDWEILDVIKEATCVDGGLVDRRCYVCGTTEENVETPPTGHTWIPNGERVEPTCDEDGYDPKICDVCKTTVNEPVPALGHQWKFTKILQSPTCTEKGSNLQTCDRCQETQEVEVRELGHNFEGVFTVDVRPGFDHAGEKSYHCTRCSARNEVTVIPQLEENTPIEYEFRIRRNNGDLVVNKGGTVTVKDEEGNVVATSKAGETSTGVYRVSLLPKTYTATLTSLPDGFFSEGSCTVEAEDPYCTMWVGNAPIQGSIPAGKRFLVGDVMYDFTFKTVDNKTVSLSSLLEEKDVVVLNFFYTTCVWCQREFPGLETAYQLYKDKVEVLAIDPYSYMRDSEDSIRAFKAEKRLSFLFASDTTLNLHNNFGLSGFPASVFIDKEGVIERIDTSALVETDADGNYHSERLYSEIFEAMTSESYWKNPAKQQQAVSLPTGMPALPVRKKFL